MVRPVIASVVFAVVTAQTQAPPPIVPTASPFAAAAIKRPGEGTPVALTFAWPPGLTATIESERTKTMVTPAGQRSERVTLRYRMRVSAHPDGRLIEYDNFEFGGVPLSSEERTSIDQALSSLMPSLVVSESGEFVRVGDLSKIRAILRQLMDRLKKEAPGGIPPNLQAMLDNLASDKTLTALAAAEWQATVGAYVGFNGRIGETAEFDSEEAIPAIPGITVPMRTSFGARHLSPCHGRQATADCVVMHSRSVVAPGAMQAVVKRLLDGVKGLEDVKYDYFDITTEIQSTLEPATMRPHLVTLTKGAQFTVTAPGQRRTNASTSERRTYRFIYH